MPRAVVGSNIALGAIDGPGIISSHICLVQLLSILYEVPGRMTDLSPSLQAPDLVREQRYS